MTHAHEQHFHQLSAQLDKHLHEIGLSPAYVERLVRDTILEDLDGGYDVTTTPRFRTTIAAKWCSVRASPDALPAFPWLRRCWK